MPTNKHEIKLLFGILLLQDMVQKPEMGDISLETNFWKCLLSVKIHQKRDFFILVEFLNVAVNEAYHGQVSLKIYKMEPLFGHLIMKYFLSYYGRPAFIR
jgi:hypothetical protein